MLRLVSRSLATTRAVRAMHAAPELPKSSSSPPLPLTPPAPHPLLPPPTLASEPVTMIDSQEARSGISIQETDPGECKLPPRALEEMQLGIHVFTSYAESSVAVDAFSEAVTRRNTPAERTECLAKSAAPAPSAPSAAPESANENKRA